jgi:hypothetical protein
MNRRTWSWSRAGALVFVVAVSVVLIAVVIKWAPQWLASTNGLRSANDRDAEVGRVRTALFALLAGGIAVVGAIYTARTFALNRQGQITERFTRAVDQLGSEQINVRLGGIYALERLARESRDDHGPIVEILTAYVRERAPWPPRAGASPNQIDQPTAASGRDNAEGEGKSVALSTDVQAVLTVLGRRTVAYDTGILLQLESTDLSQARLRGANLVGAHLEGANLKRAELVGANLVGANLVGANLVGAHLEHAYLEHAYLVGAHLEHAYLGGAYLVGADLEDAHLEGANLVEAHLEDAHLEDAHLGGAHLVAAHLEDAHLEGAHLESAHLMGVHLEGADLEGAHLEGANLEQALYDRRTVWPEPFDLTASRAVLKE